MSTSIDPDVSRHRIAVTGAASRLGRSVVASLVAAGEQVVAIDNDALAVPEGAQAVQANLLTDDLAPHFEGCDIVVHLDLDGTTEKRARAARVNVTGTRRVLRAATEAGAHHVVLRSSALVYGSWPNNPVPITEDAALRPNQELALAVQHAQREQLVDDWAAARPDRTAAVVRPTVVVGTVVDAWVMRALIATAGSRARDDEPPRQFVHVDDLADAIVLAARQRLDGAWNVAPDGAMVGGVLRDLVGTPLRLPLPDGVVETLTRWRWRFLGGPVPPGLLPFVRHGIVVANDRLQAHGWEPRWTNEEAFVAGTEARWWTLLSPKRKQELALAGAGALLAGTALSVGLVVRRIVKRRRARSLLG